MESMEERVHVYIHSLMENHPLNKEVGVILTVGEAALLLGDEKNQGEWRTKRVLCLLKAKEEL